MVRRSSFAPAGAPAASARLLLLGSLPGEASLRAGRYYAHPRNGFWRLVGEALGEPLAELGDEERLARLSARGIALWDVIASAERKGSLDTAIRAAEANPLGGFLAAAPRLRGVGFNGKTAARLGRRALGLSAGDLLLFDLPSSSPAFTMAYADKAAAWRAIAALAYPGERVTLAP